MDTAENEKTDPLAKGATLSAWLMYVVIVFEILFMVSPAALYYYSAYSLPLNALASSPYTSWLTQYVLPHFTYHQSTIGAHMVAVSWPLIVLGLLMFLWGFCQIYYAKFTGKQEVTGGLYRYIRHPQYTGLAIAGLGTTFFWSRFLVVIGYVTMLFLYVALARYEEHRCTTLYGERYRDYLRKTGRFLPQSWTRWLPQKNWSTSQVFVLYLVTLVLAVAGGWKLKQQVINEMMVLNLDRVTAVVLAPMDEVRAQRVLEVAVQNIETTEPRLAYVVPGNWNIPELGIKPDYAITAKDELSHPMLHGNVPEYDGTLFHVLVAEPVLRTEGELDLMNVIGIKPLFRLDIDDVTQAVTVHKNLDEGRWAGFPVPVY